MCRFTGCLRARVSPAQLLDVLDVDGDGFITEAELLKVAGVGGDDILQRTRSMFVGRNGGAASDAFKPSLP